MQNETPGISIGYDNEFELLSLEYFEHIEVPGNITWELPHALGCMWQIHSVCGDCHLETLLVDCSQVLLNCGAGRENL